MQLYWIGLKRSVIIGRLNDVPSLYFCENRGRKLWSILRGLLHTREEVAHELTFAHKFSVSRSNTNVHVLPCIVRVVHSAVWLNVLVLFIKGLLNLIGKSYIN